LEPAESPTPVVVCMTQDPYGNWVYVTCPTVSGPTVTTTETQWTSTPSPVDPTFTPTVTQWSTATQYSTEYRTEWKSQTTTQWATRDVTHTPQAQVSTIKVTEYVTPKPVVGPSLTQGPQASSTRRGEDSPSIPATALPVVERTTEFRTVTVYVTPNEPQVALAQPAPSGGDIGSLVAIGVLVCVGVGIGLRGAWKRARDQKKEPENPEVAAG
jgi:hypothetical protein